MTLSVVFVDVLWSEILSFSEIVRQAKTMTKGMLYGDKKVERRGDIVRKPNKILHKIMQFSAASLSLCDKTMRFANDFAKSAAKKVCSLLLKRQMPCYNECDKEVWNEKVLDDTHHDHIGARALRHCMRRQHRSEQRGRGRTARSVGHFAAI